MIKDDSDERKNSISSNGYFFMPHPTDRAAHTTGWNEK